MSAIVMAEILDSALVRAAPAKVRSAAVPAEFRIAVARHQNNLIALSAALRTAGMTPVTAAGCIDDALASFQIGLSAAIVEQEESHCGQY